MRVWLKAGDQAVATKIHQIEGSGWLDTPQTLLALRAVRGGLDYYDSKLGKWMGADIRGEFPNGTPLSIPYECDLRVEVTITGSVESLPLKPTRPMP